MDRTLILPRAIMTMDPQNRVIRRRDRGEGRP